MDGPLDEMRMWSDEDGPVKHDNAGRCPYQPPPLDLAVPAIADVLSVRSECFRFMTSGSGTDSIAHIQYNVHNLQFFRAEHT